jgi:L-aspartate oxidase
LELEDAGDIRRTLAPPVAATDDLDASSRGPTRSALQELMWSNVGIVRDETGLSAAAARLASWALELKGEGRQVSSDRASLELANMVLVGRLMAEAAHTREESRGAHFRTDWPDPRELWRRHIVFSKS